jgi:hypothetical protein
MTTTVKAELSYTHNLGNFKSIKVQAGIEDDVRAGETVDQAYDRVYSKVEEQLARRIAKAIEDLGDVS